MTMPEGYDPVTYEYVGPCPKCGTDHGTAGGPETLGGALACARAGAETLGLTDIVDRVDMVRDYARLAQANALGLPSELDDPGLR